MTGRDPLRLPGWLLSVGLALAIAGVVVQTTAHLTQAFAFPSLDELSADRDSNNPFAWASSVTIFSAALTTFVLYGLSRRWTLLLLAVALMFFSVDDIVGVHEKLALRSESALNLVEYSRRAVWVVLFMPLLAYVTIVLVSIARRADPRTRRFIYVGLGLLIFGVGVEASSAVTHHWGYEGGSTYDVYEVAVEEGSELAGWILVASALTAHMTWALITAQTKEKTVN
jgi:hypothetical protein